MLITLTTDFGNGSPYVAAMKGVILSINPAATIIDLTHAVPPQDVRGGAVALAETTPWFPANSIHVGVVDPGVGSARGLLYAQIGGQQYLAPDNGLLSRILIDRPAGKIIALQNPQYWLPNVSATFHGRDVLAPVAAHLSLSADPERLGPPATGIVRLPWPQPVNDGSSIVGEVTHVDSFGNCVTNIPRDMLQGHDSHRLSIQCAGRTCRGLCRTYADRQAGELVALVGSSGLLELAVVNGSAAALLQTAVGQTVVVHW